MLAKSASAARQHATTWWALYRAARVPAWLLGGLMVAGFLVAVSQVVLAVSLVARFVFVARFDFEATDALIQSWESYIGWPPLLVTGVVWTALVAWRDIPDRRVFREQFLGQHGDSLLIRAALKEARPPFLSEYVPAVTLSFMALLFGGLAIITSNDGVGFMLTFVLLMLVLCIALEAPVGRLIHKISQNKQTLQKYVPATLWRLFAPKKSIRDQFKDLPEHERAAVASQVASLGADPNSEVLMRAAVVAYNERVKKVMSAAKSLDTVTPAVAPVSEHTPSTRRL